jgi:hypothetical protein
MDRPMEHRPTILVPLDGSSFGDAILGSVDALARPLRARVILLSVAQPAGATERPLADAAQGGPAVNGALRAVSDRPVPDTWHPSGLPVEEVLTGYLRRVASELEGVETRLVVDFADDPLA